MISPNPWMILPFALLLLAMALGPLLAPNGWLRHYAKISFGLGAVTLGYYLFMLRDAPRVLHTAHDYISFIVLIGSLFIVSGGIHVGIKGNATPAANVIFLFAGAILANIFSTTGAAMLLIRPWIRMNRCRVAPHHIAFFIFIVANAGGCLTPVGDPPLFLGYLQGVPFWWVAEHCWLPWTVGVGMLLCMFYIVDKINFARPPRTSRGPEVTGESRTFAGLPNLVFLAAILGAVFVSGPIFLRETLMLAAAAGSYFTTKKSVHEANQFDFHPVQEVAVLFAGVFATMMPTLDWVGIHAQELLGAGPSPGTFFWSTGALSAVLDNAPTYLGFLSALSGVTGAPDVSSVLAQHPAHVLAISLGAVFFGAATYIGNGPNFMVKAVAEQAKISMPGFFGFVFKYALPCLLPVFITIWLLFFFRD